jgi:Ca2+-binding RTX toxin-like protein
MNIISQQIERVTGGNMPSLVAGAAFDMEDLIANGSLAEFFEFGEVVTGTETEFVVTYSDETISERLTLTGEFGEYVDGYPTTGIITSASYELNGVTLFTITGIEMSVEDFTAYVMGDDLAGLFDELLAGVDGIYGSDGNDVLLGLGGDDSMRGGLGSDELYGGEGNDFLSESSDLGPYGDDVYDGGSGIDRVSFWGNALSPITVDLRIETAQDTGRGVDTLVGIEHVTSDYGDDTLIGNDAANWFWTFSGLDRLTGNGGDDYFTVGRDTKIINGGEGSDTVEILDLAYEPLYTADGITVSLLLQGQSQATGAGSWRLSSIENLVGSYGSDEFTGDANANYLGGAEGDDRLIGGAGDDTLAGDGTVGLDTVDGGSGPIVFVENPDWEGWVAGDDYLDGGDGNDRLVGGDGSDFLIGGSGTDVMDGGAGADVYAIGSAADHTAAEIADTGADDSIDEVRFTSTSGTAQTLLLRSGDSGIERIVIGTGTGTTASTTGTTGHNVDARALDNGVHILGNSGANTLYSTAVGDWLEGGNGDDRFYAYGGSDTLDGGRGADVMYGGTGDDAYIVDHLSDAPIEQSGEGTDTVYASVAHTLKANVEHLEMTGIYSIHATGNGLANTITGNSGANRMWGEGGDDTLIGNDGYDQLDGGAGSDVMIGGTGNDIYFVDSTGDAVIELVGEGRDTVRTSIDWTLGDNVDWLELQGSASVDGTGNDLANVLKGNSGANVLTSLGGNDKIYANAGDDTVDGGDGNDWLEGEEGRDVHTGGAGSDRFVFREGDFGGNTTATADVITDFGDAEGDRIRLDLADADTNVDGDQDFVFIADAAFTGTAGELRFEQIDGNTYVQGDTNGDGVADFMIRLDGLHTLGTDDFIF